MKKCPQQGISLWDRGVRMESGYHRELIERCIASVEERRGGQKNIHVVWVPGSFELAHGAQLLIESQSLDAVICLGSIIKGETPHFDFVSQATAQGIMNVGLQYALPVVFGVLTDANHDQAKARSGGKLGNKGVEAGVTAIKMALLRDKLNA